MITKKRLDDSQLPLDLLMEILKKLPAKSLMRFRCVSKQWLTIISKRRDFIDSIVSRPLAQKLPLFIIHHYAPEPFFTVSSSFSQNPNPKVSLILNSYVRSFLKYQCVRGLICCFSYESGLVAIYNLTTRQSFLLPKITLPNTINYSFGYDPDMNQYKVLSMIVDKFDNFKKTFRVYTLGSPISMQYWRQVQGNIDENLFPSFTGVCINGTIYYTAIRRLSQYQKEMVLLSFDIKSERFNHVRAPKTLLEALPTYQNLVNYLGKLGCICCNYTDTSMWIMENAEKQEWSRIKFWLPEYAWKCLGGGFYRFSGVTRTGEIVVVQRDYDSTKSSSFYSYYYDMKQNSFRRVEMEVSRRMR